MSDKSADQPTNEKAPEQPATQQPYPKPTIDFGDAPVTAPQQPPYGHPSQPAPSDGGTPPYVGTPSGANQPTDPFGAPQQPTPPYGAPQQPTPPYGAPQQPHRPTAPRTSLSRPTPPRTSLPRRMAVRRATPARPPVPAVLTPRCTDRRSSPTAPSARGSSSV